MFGLKVFFAALSRLTASVNRSADLFEAANVRLAEQLAFEEPAALEHQEQRRESANVPPNGTVRIEHQEQPADDRVTSRK